MSHEKFDCPKKKKDPELDPKGCTPEQIRECHGDQPEHPCEDEDEKKS